MKVFNVTVEGVISVFAEDEDDAVGKVGEMISSRADFGGQLRAIHAASARDSGKATDSEEQQASLAV